MPGSNSQNPFYELPKDVQAWLVKKHAREYVKIPKTKPVDLPPRIRSEVEKLRGRVYALYIPRHAHTDERNERILQEYEQCQKDGMDHCDAYLEIGERYGLAMDSVRTIITNRRRLRRPKSETGSRNIKMRFEARNLREKGSSLKEASEILAKRYGLAPTYVCAIIQGHSSTHLS